MLRVQRKTGRPVVKGNAIARHNYAAAEALKIALDIGNHVAFAVRGTKVNRAAAKRIARLRQQCLPANQRAALRRIFVTQKLFNLSLHIARVGNVFAPVGVSQLHRFNFVVQVFHAVLTVVRKALQNIQRH